MKYVLFLFCCVSLAGCASLQEGPGQKSVNILDIAPKTDLDVRYPDWGGETPADLGIATAQSGEVMGPMGQSKNAELVSLTTFLDQSGIEYVSVPGNYPIIKVKEMINFKLGSTTLSPKTQEWLSIVGRYLSKQNAIDIVIDGHTDSSGTDKINQKLSESRSQKVRLALLAKKISPKNIYTRGYGDKIPLCDNKSNTGKACNRRVELSFILPNNK